MKEILSCVLPSVLGLEVISYLAFDVVILAGSRVWQCLESLIRAVVFAVALFFSKAQECGPCLSTLILQFHDGAFVE